MPTKGGGPVFFGPHKLLLFTILCEKTSADMLTLWKNISRYGHQKSGALTKHCACAARQASDLLRTTQDPSGLPRDPPEISQDPPRTSLGHPGTLPGISRAPTGHPRAPSEPPQNSPEPHQDPPEPPRRSPRTSLRPGVGHFPGSAPIAARESIPKS